MAVFMGLMAGAVFNSCIAFVWQVCDHGTPALLQWGVWAFQLVVMVLIVSHNAAYHWTPNGYVAGLVAFGAAYVAGRAVLWFVEGARRIAGWFKKKAPPQPQADGGPPGETETIAKIQKICWLAGMSAENVARDKEANGPPKEWDTYEHDRYARLRAEASQLADSLTDEFYRGAAIHFLVDLCMTAGDVDDARALLEIDIFRDKIIKKYPQFAR